MSVIPREIIQHQSDVDVHTCGGVPVFISQSLSCSLIFSRALRASILYAVCMFKVSCKAFVVGKKKCWNGSYYCYMVSDTCAISFYKYVNKIDVAVLFVWSADDFQLSPSTC